MRQIVTQALITPTCRENRGDEGAWDEAVRRLRAEYDAVIDGWKDKDEQPSFQLVLNYDRPEDETAVPIPPLFCGRVGVYEGSVAG